MLQSSTGISRTSALNALYSTTQAYSGKQAATAATPATANAASTSHISDEARARYLSETQEAATTPATVKLATDLGDKELNLGTYFTQPSFSASNPLPIILPTAANVKALAADISSKMPQFLAKYGLASAPAKIEYDSQGELTLPADYPYAEQFKAALAQEPALSHEISALNGIASHTADLIRMAPGQAALASATTDEQAQAIMQQYGMTQGHRSPLISLLFDASGQVSIAADGQAVPDFA